MQIQYTNHVRAGYRYFRMDLALDISLPTLRSEHNDFIVGNNVLFV